MHHTFDTDSFPPGERFAAWREMTQRSLVPTVLSTPRPADFTGTARFLHLGEDTQLSVLSYRDLRTRRTPALVRASDPENLQVALTVSGRQGLDQGRNTCLARGGDLLLYDTSSPFTADVHAEDAAERVEAVILHVRRAALAPRLRDPGRLLATTLPAHEGIASVLTGFLRHLAEHRPALTPWDARRLGPVAVQLTEAFLAHHEDVPLAPESRPQALLAAVLSFVDRNLSDPGLTPGAIAAAHHISVRYLHRLFAQRQLTVGGWIRRRRLEECRRDLRDPRLDALPVRAIGARWGFATPSDFNRAFRAVYALPPATFRRARP